MQFNSWVRKIPWRWKWQLSPVFAWRIPWTEESDALQSEGSHRVRHTETNQQVCTHMCIYTYILCYYYVSNYWQYSMPHVRHLLLMKLPFQCERHKVYQYMRLLLHRFSRVRLSVTPQMAAHQATHPWDSPGKNTGVGCHFLLHLQRLGAF